MSQRVKILNDVQAVRFATSREILSTDVFATSREIRDDCTSFKILTRWLVLTYKVNRVLFYISMFLPNVIRSL